jgi:hypothetical protein
MVRRLQANARVAAAEIKERGPRYNIFAMSSYSCRMDLPGPTTSVGTKTDYSVGPWDYSACATRHLMA